MTLAELRKRVQERRTWVQAEKLSWLGWRVVLNTDDASDLARQWRRRQHGPPAIAEAQSSNEPATVYGFPVETDSTLPRGAIIFRTEVSA